MCGYFAHGVLGIMFTFKETCDYTFLRFYQKCRKHTTYFLQPRPSIKQAKKNGGI